MATPPATSQGRLRVSGSGRSGVAAVGALTHAGSHANQAEPPRCAAALVKKKTGPPGFNSAATEKTPPPTNR